MQNESKHKRFTIDDIMNSIETWLVSGNLNPDVLSEEFRFTSPFWKNANRAEFLAQFENPKSYKDAVLSKITRFDPVIQFKNSDNTHFAIILQYHTKNNSQVYETVLGTVEDELLIQLRSIYDLDETKKALEIE